MEQVVIVIRKRLNGGTVPPFKMHLGETVLLRLAVCTSPKYGKYLVKDDVNIHILDGERQALRGAGEIIWVPTQQSLRQK